MATFHTTLKVCVCILYHIFSTVVCSIDSGSFRHSCAVYSHSPSVMSADFSHSSVIPAAFSCSPTAFSHFSSVMPVLVIICLLI